MDVKDRLTDDDLRHNIIRLEARERRWGLTPGETAILARCYHWLAERAVEVMRQWLEENTR